MTRLPSAALLAQMLALMLAAVPAAAAGPDQPAGTEAPAAGGDDRYTMSETADGFLRLDRKTGVVSLCTGGEGRWSCVPVPDAQAALDQELKSLEDENRELAARVEQLEARLRDIAGSAESGLPQKDGEAPAKPGRQPDEDKLSESEQRQLDKFLDFSERAMRRFFGVMKTLRDEYEKGI